MAALFEEYPSILHGNAKFDDKGLLEIQPGFMDGQGLIFPFSKPVGKFWACEKGVGEEGKKELELMEGIAGEGSGEIRATAIARETKFFDQRALTNGTCGLVPTVAFLRLS